MRNNLLLPPVLSYDRSGIFFTCLKALAALFASLVLLSSCTSEQKHAYSVQKVDHSSKGMVVAAHPLASKTGIEILEQGGNAIDAAIATQLTLAVVHPRAGNLGGGGFLVYLDSAGHSFVLDFREEAPGRSHRNMYLDSTGNVIEGLSFKGPLAAGVPGSVAGMEAAHNRFGRLEWKTLFGPAIRYASEGYPILQREADRLNKHKPEFLEWNDPGIPFIKEDPWMPGDLLCQPALAETLRKLAKGGAQEFYHGSTGDAIITTISGLGGIMQKADLQSYQAQWRDPMTTDYKGYTLLAMPLPSSGGIVLAQILEMLEHFSLGEYEQGSVRSIHLMIEAERRAFADRAGYLGDPDVIDVPVEKLLDSTYLAEKMHAFTFDTVTPSASISETDTSSLIEHFETTHLSVIDKDGNAVSLTTTLNDNFGCKVFVKEAGFFLNNEMDDFSIKPGIANYYGLIGNEANAIAPGKRMLSSMTPTIVAKQGKPFLILGSHGGPTIITSNLQVILNVIEYDMSLEEAVLRKRFHHQWLPDEVRHEAHAFSPAVRDSLEKLGHVFKQIQSFGAVPAILVTADGTYLGVADDRADDHAEGM